MATSQFTIYKSSDSGSPQLSGTSGSLISMLDACLVNGYGAKAGAGWKKPFANVGAVGCYQLPTGSTGAFVLQDHAPGVGSAREARICGYDFLSSVDNGTNPFPSGSQGVAATTSGSFVVVRKSSVITTAVVPWMVFADSWSMYTYIKSGDVLTSAPDIWTAFYFGDIYSFATGSDTGSCMIVGRSGEAAAATVTNEKLDVFSAVGTATAGHFVQHTWNMSGSTGVTCGKMGDTTKAAAGGTGLATVGVMLTPHPINQGLYIVPVLVHHNSNSSIRGKMRGLWHLCHPRANFINDQTISGSSGRIFQIVSPSGNSGHYCMEISNTLPVFDHV